MTRNLDCDVAVIGGGPAGATAAETLARAGRHVLLVDRAGRIKPCGGAIPPRLIRDFAIPGDLLVAKARGARIVSPKSREIAMPIADDGFVGMVDRDVFDEFLRRRAASAGATRLAGRFAGLERDRNGRCVLRVAAEDGECEISARAVIGADGANSAVARAAMPDIGPPARVFAYHEVIRAPRGGAWDGARCDIHYNGAVSPDFYAWVFPHGETASIGTGSAVKGFALRGAVASLRRATGLDAAETIRCEGAPLPLRPLKRWDDGASVLLAGDAAGVVAPASGEGIYYAMVGGRLAAEAMDEFCANEDARVLGSARTRFMREHGRVFAMLGLMQRYWYANDSRRERFVAICADRDVQSITWQSYMEKSLVRTRPAAHLRIFAKNIAHLTGLARA